MTVILYLNIIVYHQVMVWTHILPKYHHWPWTDRLLLTYPFNTIKNRRLKVYSHIIPKYHRSPSSDGVKSYITQTRPMTMNWWFTVNLSLNTIKNRRLIVDSYLIPKISSFTIKWWCEVIYCLNTTNDHELIKNCRLIGDSHVIPKYHRSPSSDRVKSYFAQIPQMTMNGWFTVFLSLITIKNHHSIVDS